MKRSTRIVGVLLAGLFLAGGLSACSSIAAPDEVGLYYMEGPIDGYHFDHCFDPGTTTDYEWNNSTVRLPSSLRTWNMAGEGGDTNQPITVNSAPEADQPSGVQVNLWMQTNFILNTNCDGGKDSPVVQFWEKIGRRYKADTTDGWKTMLQNTIVTALETSSRSVVRGYTADQLVSGLVREEVQTKIAQLFQTEIKRVAGGDYFCSPTFDRVNGECGEVQVLLKDVDYTNPAIQQARDEKQAAVERAAAQVAAAQGQVEAAAKLEELYQNAAWVQLQIAQTQLTEVQACAANPNCTIVIGGNGAIITSSGNRG